MILVGMLKPCIFQVSRIEKVGGASSKGENSYGIEIFCKVCPRQIQMVLFKN